MFAVYRQPLVVVLCATAAVPWAVFGNWMGLISESLTDVGISQVTRMYTYIHKHELTDKSKPSGLSLAVTALYHCCHLTRNWDLSSNSAHVY